MAKFASGSDFATRNGRFGFPVCEVLGLMQFSPEDYQPIPATLAGAQAHYVSALLCREGREIGCLEAEILFYTLERGLA